MCYFILKFWKIQIFAVEYRKSCFFLPSWPWSSFLRSSFFILFDMWISREWWKIGQEVAYYCHETIATICSSIGVFTSEIIWPILPYSKGQGYGYMYISTANIFANGNGYVKHYYCHKIGTTKRSFNWYIHTWSEIILKVKIKVIHISTTYIVNGDRYDKRYFCHKIGTTTCSLERYIYIWTGSVCLCVCEYIVNGDR